MKKEIIYQKVNVVPMWCSGIGDFNAKLITYIVRYRLLGFTWYKIKQSVPYLNAFYDGEFSANKRAQDAAREDKAETLLKLQCYKRTGKWDNNEQ